MSSEKQSKMMAALEENLPVIMPPTPLLPAALNPAPDKAELISDAEEDYRYSRKKLKSLIDKAEESLERLSIVADEAEHPRAFEVLAGMLETTSNMTDKLMDLQKKRKDFIQGKNSEESPKQAAATNVAVFVGTTSELQKQLASDANTTIIDAKSA